MSRHEPVEGLIPFGSFLGIRIGVVHRVWVLIVNRHPKPRSSSQTDSPAWSPDRITVEREFSRLNKLSLYWVGGLPGGGRRKEKKVIVIAENNTIAPDFELPNQFGEIVRLSQLRGVKPVALVFFPLAFTGICTGELCELRDNFAMFEHDGVELLAVSVDSKATLRVFAEQEGYPFTLLADFWPHGAVARDYGVLLEDRGHATRATFVIDLDGIIRSSFVTAPGEARSLDAYRDSLATLALPAV